MEFLIFKPTTHLVPFLLQHIVVSVVGDGEDVRRQDRPDPLVLIQPHILGIVDGMELERVDRYQDTPDVGVDVASLEALPQVFQQRRLIEVC